MHYMEIAVVCMVAFVIIFFIPLCYFTYCDMIDEWRRRRGR
jgi:hypothetical protein